jgi:predicted PurR-regulated permease PerM
MALAAVSAVLLPSSYKILAKLFRAQKCIAAAVTVGMLLIFIIVPLFFLGIQILHEAQNLYSVTSGNVPHYIQVIQNTIEHPMQRFFPGFVFNIQSYLGNVLSFISANLESLIYKTFSVIFETFLMLLAIFFFLRDGDDMLASFVHVNPLGKETTKEILDTMYKTIGAVMKGTLVNALIRWACISVAFYCFGIPNAILWGCLGGIVGAIPGLGTPFAFIPAVAYLYLQGNILAAIGLAVSGIAIIILVDNMLTSYFFGKGLAVAPIFILFSLFGGIVFFGPLGFILGPLVLSVFLSVIRAYR